MMSAHAHPGEIRAPVSSRYPSLSLPILMNPSVSPIGLMMPSYSILDLPHFGVPKIYWRSLNLLDYYVTQIPLFYTNDPQQQYNISLGEVSTIRTFTQAMSTDIKLFGRYLFSKMGYPSWLVEVTSQVWQLAAPFTDVFNQKKFTCGMLYFEDTDYQLCSQ